MSKPVSDVLNSVFQIGPPANRPLRGGDVASESPFEALMTTVEADYPSAAVGNAAIGHLAPIVAVQAAALPSSPTSIRPASAPAADDKPTAHHPDAAPPPALVALAAAPAFAMLATPISLVPTQAVGEPHPDPDQPLPSTADLPMPDEDAASGEPSEAVAAVPPPAAGIPADSATAPAPAKANHITTATSGAAPSPTAGHHPHSGKAAPTLTPGADTTALDSEAISLPNLPSSPESAVIQAATRLPNQAVSPANRDGQRSHPHLVPSQTAVAAPAVHAKTAADITTHTANPAVARISEDGQTPRPHVADSQQNSGKPAGPIRDARHAPQVVAAAPAVAASETTGPGEAASVPLPAGKTIHTATAAPAGREPAMQARVDGGLQKPQSPAPASVVQLPFLSSPEQSLPATRPPVIEGPAGQQTMSLADVRVSKPAAPTSRVLPVPVVPEASQAVDVKPPAGGDTPAETSAPVKAPSPVQATAEIAEDVGEPRPSDPAAAAGNTTPATQSAATPARPTVTTPLPPHAADGQIKSAAAPDPKPRTSAFEKTEKTPQKEAERSSAPARPAAHQTDAPIQSADRPQLPPTMQTAHLPHSNGHNSLVTTLAPALPAADPILTAAAQTSTASASVTQPLSPSNVPVEIATRLHEGQHRFEIRLDPPELGRIDVRLDIDHDGQVTSRLIVERAETLDLLKRDAPQLERALQDAGFKTSDSGLQFSLRDQGFADRDPNQGMPHHANRMIAPERETVAADTISATYGAPARKATGIDMRV